MIDNCQIIFFDPDDNQTTDYFYDPFIVRTADNRVWGYHWLTGQWLQNLLTYGGTPIIENVRLVRELPTRAKDVEKLLFEAC